MVSSEIGSSGVSSAERMRLPTFILPPPKDPKKRQMFEEIRFEYYRPTMGVRA